MSIYNTIAEPIPWAYRAKNFYPFIIIIIIIIIIVIIIIIIISNSIILTGK